MTGAEYMTPRQNLDAMRVLYEQSGEPREGERGQKYERLNPVFAWRAYRHARGNHAPVPEWVLRYFDRVASALWELESDPPARTANALPAALELDVKPRGRTAFDRAKDSDQRFAVAICVRELIDEDPDKPLPVGHACAIVAEDFEISASTARNYYLEYRELLFPCDK